jgi:hypothetical protein
MPRRARSIVTREAIAEAFAKAGGAGDRPIVSRKQLAEIFGVKPKTISVWVSKGHLDGSFRKRGKYLRFWRDKALDILFNGPEWEHKTKCKTTEKNQTSSETECASTSVESNGSTVRTSGTKASIAESL